MALRLKVSGVLLVMEYQRILSSIRMAPILVVRVCGAGVAGVEDVVVDAGIDVGIAAAALVDHNKFSVDGYGLEA